MNRNKIISEDVCRIVENVDMSELENKEILITGASGLIGTYFLYSLWEYVKRGGCIKKVYIVIMQNLPEHLKELKAMDWLEIRQGDLCQEDFCQSLPESDYIIHGAGYGQPAKFTANQDKTLKLNTVVTFSLLDKLNEGGKFLFLSSSTVYNGLNKEIFLEEDIGTTNTLHPRACYIEGKRCGETICNAYREKGVMAKSARISYTYGPGVRREDNRALYTFIRNGMAGDITLLDDGSAQRIYCYISDVVEMLWNILLFGKEAIYNVGGKDSITILELAEMIAQIFSGKVIPGRQNGLSGNALVERLDTGKIDREFGQTSFTPMQEGIKRTIQWMQDEI